MITIITDAPPPPHENTNTRVQYCIIEHIRSDESLQ